MNIPEKIAGYNIYTGIPVEKLMGISGEITLPTFEKIKSTVSGAGILGEVESGTLAHFSAMTLEIGFNVLYEAITNMFAEDTATITLRAAKQSYAVQNGKRLYTPFKVVVKGEVLSLDPGKVAAGSAAEGKFSIGVDYIKIEDNGKILVELDKYNEIFKVNDEDLYREIRNMT